MKKIIKNILFAFIFMFVSITMVDAAGANISASTNSCYVGDSVTITVSYNGGAWDIYLTGAVSDAIVGYDQNAVNTSGSKSVTFTPTAVGTYTINMSGTITDADTDVTSNVSGSVTITASERPAPQPDPTPAPSPQPSPQPSQPTPQQPSNPTPQQEQKEEPKHEEPKKEEIIKEDPIVVESIIIAGFNIDFSEKQTEYELVLDEGVTNIYLTSKSNGEASINGLVDIKDKKEITITFTKGSLTKDYKIKISYKTRANDETTTETIEEKEKNEFNIFIVTTVVFGLTTLLFAGLFIKSKISNKTSISNTQELDKPIIHEIKPLEVQDNNINNSQN